MEKTEQLLLVKKAVKVIKKMEKELKIYSKEWSCKVFIYNTGTINCKLFDNHLRYSDILIYQHGIVKSSDFIVESFKLL